MTRRRRLLWIGDAVASTGFARATHCVLDVLRKTWDVAVLGIQYDGDPHAYSYPIYPASRANRPEDMFGCKRSGEIVARIKPDLNVILQDPWNMPRYVEHIRAVDENVPIIGYVAVDGKNCQGKALSGLAKCIFWTKFGEIEAQLGGYDGDTGVVPLGVDTALYRPHDRQESRRRLAMTDRVMDSFIVGVVGRNQVRKRLDLIIDYFAEWMHETGIADAQLMFHVAPTGEQGFDLKQLGEFHRLRGHMLLSSPNFYFGSPEADMPYIYSAMDVYVSATQGEGMGLTALEAMACRVPCILSDWSAYGEWAHGAASLVPCTDIAYTPIVNTQGGIMGRQGFKDALSALYSSPLKRRRLAQAGYDRATEARFQWANIGAAFAREIEHFPAIEVVPDLVAVEA